MHGTPVRRLAYALWRRANDWRRRRKATFRHGLISSSSGRMKYGMIRRAAFQKPGPCLSLWISNGTLIGPRASADPCSLIDLASTHPQPYC